MKLLAGPLFAVAAVAAVATEPPFAQLSNLTATAILGWYAWHTATKAIPQLVENFRRELATERSQHRTDRDAFLYEMTEQRVQLKEAQRFRIENAAGILSPQTWSQRDGLDYDQEQANFAAYKHQLSPAQSQAIPESASQPNQVGRSNVRSLSRAIFAAGQFVPFIVSYF